MPDNQFHGAEHYQYDAQGLRRNVTTLNSSENTPGALTGYDPHIELQNTWPGLDTDPNDIRLDPQALSAVAQALRAKSVELASVPGQVRTAAMARFGPDVWPQAVALRQANEMVSTAVAEYLQRVTTNLDLAATAIEEVLRRYEAGEQQNSQNARAVDSDLGTGQQLDWNTQ
jgi:hypothetical protein